MRNSIYARMLVLITSTCMLVACGSNNQAKTDLNEGYAALENRQFDDAQSRAEAFLQKTPNGQGTAEALYLKGRALEQKPAADVNQAKANLQAARSAYLEALTHNPPKKLEALIHTGLANVAYFQDDYVNSAIEWTTAFEKLEDPEQRAWALYRLALCRQRLGQFTEADKLFISVQDQFPSTVPAQRSHEHQGVRTFSVQLATFATPQLADSAVATLVREGVVTARRQNDPRGHTIVTVGPMTSYQQAMAFRSRYVARYPDAVILP